MDEQSVLGLYIVFALIKHCHEYDDEGEAQGMEIGAPYYQSTLLPIPRQITTTTTTKVHPIPNSSIPMSQGFHHGFFGFADGFDRPTQQDQSVHNQDPSSTSIYDQTAAAAASGNMLSEMFNFSSNISATDLLANQISAGYGRFQRDPPVATPLTASDWYSATANRENTLSGTGGLGLGPLRDMAVAVKHNNTQALPPGLNADSATAMQLYLMNPPPSSVSQSAVRSPSPSSATHQALPLNHDFIAAAAAAASSFGGGVGEGQGLSLSLSSSMQQFEIAKAEELRARDGLFYYNNNPSLQHQLQGQQSQQHHGQQQLHPGFSGQIGTTNILRHSKYAKAAQELLEEFCSVGRGHLMKGKKGKRQSSSSQIGGGGASSSSSKDPPVPTLSPSDRFEHQRRKAKLLSMLDEVDRRYNHYCEQMQMVVNSFDTIMGFGAATPYTGLAQKAMSRHFRCLKDAIAAQLKNTCQLLGEKDTGIGSGITKGETPRLKLLDQSLRHQRSFHHMGMMEQEAWRPQRGLPERSVNILRAWLFEHFLHPYPSDADKHLLARQTGLTRNQVSNWFINARVRLWKPMVEEMYLQESKEEDNKQGEDETSQSPNKQKHQHQFQRPPAESSGTTSTGAAENKNVHSHHLLAPLSIPKQRLHQPFSSPSSSENPLSVSSSTNVGALPGMELPPPARVSNISGMNPETMIDYGPGTQVRFGAHGDVSLTLGLRQTGNMPDQNNRFSLRDFNGR